ncbi:cell wall protein [Metarhizium rileyi]|uniref:Cell wall protein n=1 Tax=Metarhizium rileyi (strain RCEF 4871) TaxID=1649241 RepID=A0A166Z9B2_METRR|nr:cell wall protein [Metarhizium rileyi RCEF 4871]
MQFSLSVALLLYLASGAYSLVATPPSTRIDGSFSALVDRDIDTATSVLADVKTGFDALAVAVKDFQGDVAPLKAAASSLLGKVESGTTTVKDMTPLSVFDCLSLIGPAKDLQKQARLLADQFKAKKNDIQKYKQCAVTYGFIDQGVADSAVLIAVIVSKVPDAFQGTVQSQGDKVTQELKNIRDVFASGSCSDS